MLENYELRTAAELTAVLEQLFDRRGSDRFICASKPICVRLNREEESRSLPSFYAAEISGDEITKQKIRAEAHALLGYIAARQSDISRADREAALAMAQIQNFRSWHIWSNLACTYTAMGDDDKEQSQELYDIAMLMIRNSIYQAKRSDSLPAAVREIVKDEALQPLRQRQDYKDLIAPPGAAAVAP